MCAGGGLCYNTSIPILRKGAPRHAAHPAACTKPTLTSANFPPPWAACRPDENQPGCFETALDQTAFYPEGGGQPCDLGLLGGESVLAVRIDGEGVVWHRTARPLQPGQTVQGAIDWARRFDLMQQHTGEHILSGTLHRMFGAENVGFHIGSPWVRMDMSLPLTAAQLAEAEQAANRTVQADGAVRLLVSPPGELAALDYRSKKELSGPVRLVDAGGADLCACCGTHVSTAGQVGVIQIVSAQNYKGGVRLAVACGMRAAAELHALRADAQAAGAPAQRPRRAAGRSRAPPAGRPGRLKATGSRAAEQPGRRAGRSRTARQRAGGLSGRPRRRRPAAHQPGGRGPDRRAVRGAGPRRPGAGLRAGRRPKRRRAHPLPPAERPLRRPRRRQGRVLPGQPAGRCRPRGGGGIPAPGPLKRPPILSILSFSSKAS